MPQRYAGHHLPWLLAQVFEFGIGVTCVLAGTGLTMFSNRTPVALEVLPDPIAVVFRLLLLAGGLLVVFGVYRSHTYRWSNTAERVGLYFTAGGLSAYGAALTIGGSDRATFAILVMSILAACCVVKSYALGIDAKNRLAGLRRAPTRGTP